MIVAIIPALNEEEAIGRVVRGLPRGLIDEVIVVDNGSTDATAARAAEAGARVVLEARRGYGAACIAGTEAARDASVYVFLDGDAADVTDGLEALLAPVRDGEADLVLGLRAGDVERGSMGWHQRLGNALVVGLIAWLTGRRVRDLPSLKVIDGPFLRGLGVTQRTYGWTAEVITRALLRDARVVEVEAGYRRRIGTSKVSGSVRASARAAARIIATVLECWWGLRVRRVLASAEGRGLLAGTLLAFGALGASAWWLLSLEATSPKVLVAVWLWALPALGVGAFGGLGVGRLLRRRDPARSPR